MSATTTTNESSANFKYRVLVVDDEPLVLETTAAVLSNFGFTVRTADDGFSALKILREALPDILITDLRMPNMSGFELLSVVRRRFPHIPTIAISGEFIAAANMPLGLLVDRLLEKGSYAPDQLFTLINELIAESPTRPHISKPDKAPLWIPRKSADHVLVTCTECLRSSSIADETLAGDLQTTDCIFCGTTIPYLVDSNVLKFLEEKKRMSSGSSAGTAA